MGFKLEGKGCTLVKSELLSQFKELISCCSTRKGGVSEGIYESMNLGFSNGDDPGNVRENYRIICKELGIEPSQIVLAKQTHKSNVRIITKADLGKGVTRPVDYDDVDAIITNRPMNGPSPVLGILTADCVPVSVYDPKHFAIGLAHSGWRGTVQHITAKMLKKMEEVFETRPEDVYLSTGPCICKKCYEIDEDVAGEFRRAFSSEDCGKILCPGTEIRKYRADLAKAVEITALRAGVKQENIELQDFCTACNSKLLFSHRITLGKRGTLATFLGIR
jgi:YfiH family protein